MIMWVWRHRRRRRRRRWNPIIIIIIIINCCILSFKLIKSNIIGLSVKNWSRSWHRSLRRRTVGPKDKAWGLKCALELWRPNQLSKNVTYVVSIRQLSTGTQTIQNGVLDFINKEIHNVKLGVRDQGTKEPELDMCGSLLVSHPRQKCPSHKLKWELCCCGEICRRASQPIWEGRSEQSRDMRAMRRVRGAIA
jgi:hypothetical protein